MNVTFSSSQSDCPAAEDVPQEYIVFCEVEDGVLKAVSVAKWTEDNEQRVWKALGEKLKKCLEKKTVLSAKE